MATTPRQFMALWQPQTLLAISAACLQNPQLNLWVMQLVAAQEVRISDPDTRGGIETMVAAGLATQEEADRVIAALEADRPPLRTVISSEAIPGNPQADGRFWVTEVFTLSDGTVNTANALCDAGTDYAALLAQHAAQLTAQLAQAAS